MIYNSNRLLVRPCNTKIFQCSLVIITYSLLLAEHYQELSIRAEMSRFNTGSVEECSMRLLYITINWLRHLPSFRILSKQDQVSQLEYIYVQLSY